MGDNFLRNIINFSAFDFWESKLNPFLMELN